MVMRLVNSVSFSVILSDNKLEEFKSSGAFIKGTQFPLLSLLVSSRGPFMSLKILFSVIKSHGYSGDSVGSDGESPSLRG
jgi:hypothetical protein